MHACHSSSHVRLLFLRFLGQFYVQQTVGNCLEHLLSTRILYVISERVRELTNITNFCISWRHSLLLLLSGDNSYRITNFQKQIFCVDKTPSPNTVPRINFSQMYS